MTNNIINTEVHSVNF